MKLRKFVLTAETPCQWTFATNFSSDFECDGLVHSDLKYVSQLTNQKCNITSAVKIEMLSISRDSCSISVAKLFVDVAMGIAQLS